MFKVLDSKVAFAFTVGLSDMSDGEIQLASEVFFALGTVGGVGIWKVILLVLGEMAW